MADKCVGLPNASGLHIRYVASSSEQIIAAWAVWKEHMPETFDELLDFYVTFGNAATPEGEAHCSRRANHFAALKRMR